MASDCAFCGNPGVYRKYLDDVVCDECFYFIMEFELSEQQKEEIFCFFNCLDYEVTNYCPKNYIPEAE